MKNPRFAKLLLWINCAVPVALLGWDAWHHQLGANPVNSAIRTTGLLALIFLLLSLLVTPAARLTGWNWLVHFRRIVGLCAFFHAVLHFMLFFGLDRGLSVTSTVAEVVKRPYLGLGMIGLALMAPLAATSTQAMVRRLGAKQWKKLHRLAYLAAIAGVMHYYMLVKADVRQPLAFAATLVLLLGYRLVAHYVLLRSAYNKLRATLGAPQAPAAAPPILGTAAAPPVDAKPRFWAGQLCVARIFKETHSVRTFRLVAPGGSDLPFDYRPGQYLNFSLTIDGRRVNRSYTIASAPTRRGYCEITVKREARGRVSRHMHDQVREGDLLQVTGPAGRFTFTGREAESLVLIAGGVGVTPLMAKVRYLTDRCWPGEVYLVYSVKDQGDIIFRDELEYLQRRFANLHVTVTLSHADKSAWEGCRGRITPELLVHAVPELASRPVHLCGPNEMMGAVAEMLRGLGVPAARIETESFNPTTPGDVGPAAEASAVAVADKAMSLARGATATGVATESATVTFARSGRSIVAAAGKSVLETAEALGVPIDFDCRAGICGTCKTRLLSGRVAMDVEDALNAGDRDRNLILACQAKCLGPVTVDA